MTLPPPKTSSVELESGRGVRSAPVLPPGALAGFIVAILAVAAIALFTYRALLAQSAGATRVTQTLDTIQQLETLKSNLIDAETGQRGFLLTGEESYLDPYTSGRTALTGAFAALRRQFQGDALQERRTDALEQLANERMAIIAETLSLRRAGDAAGALSGGAFRTRQGRDGSHSCPRRRNGKQRARSLDGATTRVAAGGRLLITNYVGRIGSSADPDIRGRCHVVPPVPPARKGDVDSGGTK